MSARIITQMNPRKPPAGRAKRMAAGAAAISAAAFMASGHAAPTPPRPVTPELVKAAITSNVSNAVVRYGEPRVRKDDPLTHPTKFGYYVPMWEPMRDPNNTNIMHQAWKVDLGKWDSPRTRPGYQFLITTEKNGKHVATLWIGHDEEKRSVAAGSGLEYPYPEGARPAVPAGEAHNIEIKNPKDFLAIGLDAIEGSNGPAIFLHRGRDGKINGAPIRLLLPREIKSGSR